MVYYILCSVITVIGVYITYKVVSNQDFSTDTKTSKWVNYLNASYSLSWAISCTIGGLTYYYGKCLITEQNLFLGVISLLFVLVINLMSNFKGKYIYKMFRLDKIHF